MYVRDNIFTHTTNKCCVNVSSQYNIVCININQLLFCNNLLPYCEVILLSCCINNYLLTCCKPIYFLYVGYSK